MEQIRNKMLIDEIRGVLSQDPRIDLKAYPIKIELTENEKILLSGEVPNISVKMLITKKVSTISGVLPVTEELHIEPIERLDDSSILGFVCKSLMEEPLLKNCSIYSRFRGELSRKKEPLYKTRGAIEVSVEEGVISLNNYVLDLTQKRLAGVLAWWTPGSRNVMNHLVVAPPEANRDHEMCDTIRMVMERDPFLASDNIEITTNNSTVTLEGTVETETEKQMAENNVWYLAASSHVINHLKVRAEEPFE
jgi:osmotically-inducible protein OsmY